MTTHRDLSTGNDPTILPTEPNQSDPTHANPTPDGNPLPPSDIPSPRPDSPPVSLP